MAEELDHDARRKKPPLTTVASVSRRGGPPRPTRLYFFTQQEYRARSGPRGRLRLLLLAIVAVAQLPSGCSGRSASSAPSPLDGGFSANATATYTDLGRGGEIMALFYELHNHTLKAVTVNFVQAIGGRGYGVVAKAAKIWIGPGSNGIHVVTLGGYNSVPPVEADRSTCDVQRLVPPAGVVLAAGETVKVAELIEAQRSGTWEQSGIRVGYTVGNTRRVSILKATLRGQVTDRTLRRDSLGKACDGKARVLPR